MTVFISGSGSNMHNEMTVRFDRGGSVANILEEVENNEY
jgi:hypothetical protein